MTAPRLAAHRRVAASAATLTHHPVRSLGCSAAPCAASAGRAAEVQK